MGSNAGFLGAHGRILTNREGLQRHDFMFVPICETSVRWVSDNHSNPLPTVYIYIYTDIHVYMDYSVAGIFFWESSLVEPYIFLVFLKHFGRHPISCPMPNIYTQLMWNIPLVSISYKCYEFQSTCTYMYKYICIYIYIDM
jgi:hypothetical protein